MDLTEKKLTSKLIYKGALVTLYKDTVLCPNGDEAPREYIRHVKAAAILPLTKDGKILLEHQFRYPLGKVIIEVPAGKSDGDEKPEETAKRELEEETGKKAGKLVFCGQFAPTCAYSDEVIYLYIAPQLEPGKRHLDKDELIDLFEATPAEFFAMCDKGEIVDGKTLALAYYLKRYLENREK